MEDVKRGPGRPPNVSREVREPEKPVAAPPVKEEAKAEAPKERLIEVELLRKYAPAGQDTEILKTVAPGTVLKVPQHEAARLLKAGYARGTDKTFD